MDPELYANVEQIIMHLFCSMSSRIQRFIYSGKVLSEKPRGAMGGSRLLISAYPNCFMAPERRPARHTCDS